ncbi:MAG: alpha/beta hydrolase [Phaeodactylibacter sp.]|uniref:alpha/beta hydrolase n=1 Tax=Phaeodactylibacter sp. TaxID=1940289 RepID=UPI0032EAC4A5
MLIFFLISVPLIVLTYQLIPRGTLLHEATRLPALWLYALISGAPKAPSTRLDYGSHSRQYYLSCPPAADTSGPPKWIIYFHGGSWRWGKPDFFRAHARQFTDLGYHVILPSYRPCPKHNYAQIAQDLTALLRQLRKEHPEWSPGSTLAGGMSAGGHLATLLTLDTSIINAAIPDARPLSGFFALGAPLDLNQMPPSFVLRDLAGPADGDLFRKANPVQFLPLRPFQQALVIHGDQDGMVPVAAAASFAEKAQETTARQFRFCRIDGGTHLSIAAWPFRNHRVRQLLKDWLINTAELNH